MRPFEEEEEFEGLKLRPSRQLPADLESLLPIPPWEGPPLPRGVFGKGQYTVIVKWNDEILTKVEGIEGLIYPTTEPGAEVVHLDHTVVLLLAYRPRFVFRTYEQLYVNTRLFLPGVSNLLYGEVSEKDYAPGWQKGAPWISED